jgi:hypothetical protein
MGQFRSLIDPDEVRDLCERAGIVERAGEEGALSEAFSTAMRRPPSASYQATMALRSGVHWAVGAEDGSGRPTVSAPGSEGPSGFFHTLPNADETFSDLLAHVIRATDGRAALLVDDTGSAIAMQGRADDVEAVSTVIGWARTLRGGDANDPSSAAVSLDATSVVQVLGLRGAAPAAQLGVLTSDYLAAPLIARIRRTVESSVPRIALQPAGAAWSDAALRATPWLDAVVLRDATGRRLRTWTRDPEAIEETIHRCEDLLGSCEDILRMIEATDERQRVVVESDARMIVVGVTRAADRGVFVFDGAVPPSLARLTTAALLARPPQLATGTARFELQGELTRPRGISPVATRAPVADDTGESPEVDGAVGTPRLATPTDSLQVPSGPSASRDAVPTADVPAVVTPQARPEFYSRDATDAASSRVEQQLRLLAPIVHQIDVATDDPDLTLARIALRSRATLSSNEWRDPRARAVPDAVTRIEDAAAQIVPGFRSPAGE